MFVDLDNLWESRRRRGDLPELDFHEVKYINATPDEEELHEGVIQRDPFSEEEVKIASDKYSNV